MRAAFAHVNELLETVVRLAREDLSPFSREQADLSPYEARMLLAFVGDLRRQMLEALAHLGIEAPRPSVSGRWSALTTLMFVDSALSDLTPRSLRGYGGLDPATGDAVRAVGDELHARVQEALELLRGEGYADLEASVDSVPGPAGQALREILRLARSHDLVDLYSQIAAVAERAVAPVVDIGIFGRISAGKSSLINALVGAPVLPIGATPATAVPLRVQRGPDGLRVRFKGGRSEIHPLSAVATFAAEQENPGNRRGVAGLDVYVADAPPGIRFLDTPGVAAYRTPSTASAFAWLPRCDLGLVLVAAAAAVDPEDLALIAGLEAAGVEWRVLLSKSDLLSKEDVPSSQRYVAEEMERRIGHPVADPRPVSTAADRTEGLDRLRRDVIEPLTKERETGHRARLLRRIDQLKARLEAAMRDQQSLSFADALTRRTTLNRAAKHARASATELADSVEGILYRVATEVAMAWQSGRSGEEALRDTVVAAAGKALSTVRDDLAAALRQIPGAEPAHEYAMPPLYSMDPLGALPDMRPPRFAPSLAPRYRAARRMEPLRARIAESYRSYAAALGDWAELVLDRVAASTPLDATAAENGEPAVVQSDGPDVPTESLNDAAHG
ncbi:MAG: dynamin family protein [Gemmatimonadota bacterium]